MNSFCNRTSRRRMSRPNMDKALSRIFAELSAVVDAAPEQPADRGFLLDQICALNQSIRALWGRENKMNFDARLAKLTADIQQALRLQEACLEEGYPVGARVGFRISKRQMNPTWGLVIGHVGTEDGGRVAVRVENAPQFSAHAVRQISVDQIMKVQFPCKMIA